MEGKAALIIIMQKENRAERERYGKQVQGDGGVGGEAEVTDEVPCNVKARDDRRRL